jgi:hypothetical protein
MNGGDIRTRPDGDPLGCLGDARRPRPFSPTPPPE